MTIAEMMEQSLVLTVLGMTVVFVFLWIMIVCINWVGKLVHALGWDKDVLPPKSEAQKTSGGTVPAEIAAAITGAVTEYRNQEQNHE
jgi:oxaloacetate decarboxylase gamma subunit